MDLDFLDQAPTKSVLPELSYPPRYILNPKHPQFGKTERQRATEIKSSIDPHVDN